MGLTLVAYKLIINSFDFSCMARIELRLGKCMIKLCKEPL